MSLLQSLPEQAVCSTGKSGKVLSVDIAVEKTLRAVEPVQDIENVALGEAKNRVAAVSIHAPMSVPPFANSAMDGYALSTSSFEGGSEESGVWRIPVTDRIVAGSGEQISLEHGTAARIMTGAPIPDGADVVVMQECCKRDGEDIILNQIPKPSKNIRLAGEDIAEGELIIPAKRLITSRDQALLAATGITELAVYRKLKVGLISTGNELVEPGQKLDRGQIFNSNRVYLYSCLSRPWLEIEDYGIVEDKATTIREMVREAARSCDIVITTGGVSAGEEDHMLDVLKQESAELEVLKVAMRPGKPVTVGKLGRALYLGLPGNPYACAITFMQLAWPAICSTANLKPIVEATYAIAGFSYEKPTGRTEYVPVSWDEYDDTGRPIAIRLGMSASASLLPLAKARAIAIFRSDCTKVAIGDQLRLIPVDF